MSPRNLLSCRMPNFSRLVETAKIFKLTKQTGRSFHVAFVLKGRKVVSVGFNDFRKTNPICYTYKPTRHHDPDYQACIHAEIHATGRFRNRDMKDSSMVSIRIDNHNRLAYAQPCPNCAFYLGKMNFKNIFYSTNDETFAIMQVIK
jgi:deoxycytidylate deaminase